MYAWVKIMIQLQKHTCTSDLTRLICNCSEILFAIKVCGNQHVQVKFPQNLQFEEKL